MGYSKEILIRLAALSSRKKWSKEGYERYISVMVGADKETKAKKSKEK